MSDTITIDTLIAILIAVLTPLYGLTIWNLKVAIETKAIQRLCPYCQEKRVESS